MIYPQIAGPRRTVGIRLKNLKKMKWIRWMNMCLLFVYELVSLFDLRVLFILIRIDKKTQDLTSYIDIKSEELRDILRIVLRDVYGISLNEDKPSVGSSLLL
jgi:hypothetical protein